MAKFNSFSSLLTLAVLWSRGAVWCVAFQPWPWRRSSVRTASVHGGAALAAVWRLLRRQHQPRRRPLVFPCWLLLKRQLLSGNYCVVVVLVVVLTCGYDDVSLHAATQSCS